MKRVTAILVIVLPMISCMQEKPLACTKEMRHFYLTVNGRTLDSFYTIREVNGDTIRSGNNESDGSAYWVLDDRMNETLKGKTENFRFQGIINSEVVVDELFMFRGGPCHLEKIFGKKEVDI